MKSKNYLAAAALVFQAGAAQSGQHCPPFLWGAFLSPDGQNWKELNKGILPDGRSLVHIVFDELGGEYPKHQMVVLVKDGCYFGAVVAGKYGTLEAEDGTVLSHLDLYLPEQHLLLDAMRDPPSEQFMWDTALQHLAQPPAD